MRSRPISTRSAPVEANGGAVRQLVQATAAVGRQGEGLRRALDGLLQGLRVA